MPANQTRLNPQPDKTSSPPVSRSRTERSGSGKSHTWSNGAFVLPDSNGWSATKAPKKLVSFLSTTFFGCCHDSAGSNREDECCGQRQDDPHINIPARYI